MATASLARYAVGGDVARALSRRHGACDDVTQSLRGSLLLGSCAMRVFHFPTAGLALALLGCGSDATPDATPRVYEIRFEARAGAMPFRCGQAYANVGADRSTVSPVDFRFFVHDVRLVTAGGQEVAAELVSDDAWQSQGVALLDFADGTGDCQNTTPQTNDRLRVRAPAGSYRGLRFKVGVPASLNHVNVATQPSPLNTTTLSWTWNFGYIFFAAMGRTMTEGRLVHLLHVGSTECSGEAAMGAAVTCARGHRPEVRIDGFDPERSAVVADWAAVFANTMMRQQNECSVFPMDGPPEMRTTFCGCHSEGSPAVCGPLFSAVGLDWATGANTTTQRVFRAQ